MPYVYKYTDSNDGIVKYVGISKNELTLKNRIACHTRDDWFPKGDWKIEYLYCATMSDAEALEFHFINKWETGDWYNKAKVGKGRLTILDKKRVYFWEEYCTEDPEIFGTTYEEQLEELVTQCWKLEDLAADLKCEVKKIKNNLKKSRRKGTISWINTCLIETHNYANYLNVITPRSELFESYNSYAFDNNFSMFESIGEFWDELQKRDRLSGNINKKHLVGYAIIDSEQGLKIKEENMDIMRKAFSAVQVC